MEVSERSALQFVALIATSSLARRVANLSAKRTEIIGALDVVFTGL